MRGQHRLKYLTLVAAVWWFIGSALTSVAQAQGAGVTSTAPLAAASSAFAGVAVPTPTATARPVALSPIDHAAWVSNPGSGLRPGDHVLIIRQAPSALAGTIPQAASRPEAHQTPAAVWNGQTLPYAPGAQPQPVAVRTPSSAPLAIGRAPQPAATPRLGPADHVLLVSVHPPGTNAPPTDHAYAGLDHNYSNAMTEGRLLLASLHLPSGHHLTEGQALLMDTADDSCRNPMNWSVIVHKSAYLVDVFYKGRQFDSFGAVFGRNPDHSAKEWEGDLRTPEGNYIIVEKYFNPRWRWFLRLSYPNLNDRERYDTMLNRGLVPVIDGRLRPLGGAIGIHGTDRPRFNRLHINWTLGCISVDNYAIDELEQVLPVGTLVIIKP